MRKLTFLLLFFTLFITCKKEDKKTTDPITNPVIDLSKISGKVILPEGSKLDLNTLAVSSSSSSSSISSAVYKIDTTHYFNAVQFVLNQNGLPYLMRYSYPGQPDNDFTAKSTALALVICTPAVLSLSSAGKLNIINKIQSTDNFNKLVNEVSNLLVQSKSFSDTTNTELISLLGQTLETAQTLQAQGVLDEPIIINKNGRQVTLVNNGVGCVYAVGLYKNGQRVGDIKTIEAAKYLPSSLFDIVKGIFVKIPDLPPPAPVILNLEGDGNFEIKIRSGKIPILPGLGSFSDESTIALRENAVLYFSYLFNAFSGIDLKRPCLEALKNRITDFPDFIDAISNSKSPGDAGKLMYEVSAYFFSTVQGLAECGGSPLSNNKYFQAFEKAQKIWQRLSFLLDVAQAAVTATPQVVHLFGARSEIDTCFNAKGSFVNPCDYYWLGTIIMDSHQMTGDCCDFQNQDGIPDCGTGGCQSASRALFGNMNGTAIEIAFTETSSEKNFTMFQQFYNAEKYGYSATIPTTGSFTININSYAPDRWGGGQGIICNGQALSNRNAYLNPIVFTVTSETPTTKSGTWSGKGVQVSLMHCKEDCSGTWSVTKKTGKLPTADYYPVNP